MGNTKSYNLEKIRKYPGSFRNGFIYKLIIDINWSYNQPMEKYNWWGK